MNSSKMDNISQSSRDYKQNKETTKNSQNQDNALSSKGKLSDSRENRNRSHNPLTRSAVGLGNK